ncbi:MAG: maltose alpha-D-glucosyltransferase [Acidimicrobiia bacterium]
MLSKRETSARPSGTRWFESTVFYEVLIRGFADSNGDGVGDIRGLIDRLDYLDWLGVDCLWLLPFYASPMRDGGYDIADYFTVAPEYGNLGDLVELIEQCHRRGMRVISDLVMNHTSDQHAWFQESRQSRDNPKADWYVWEDDDKRWPDAAIIFLDVETSNWSWDPIRQQYYWHRFYSHQPDLNYRNPEVVEAMLGVVRYWLDIGLDGFRLDAVPYLYEADDTNGEHLPETHTFLKHLRTEIDATHPGKVLLAEANGWPADVVQYFGDSDECHMCFHFPLMPRMFMALRRESSAPIVDVLAKTPSLPSGSQWGLFLRNHDELTLQMVDDDERVEMYARYASDPRARRNVGIGRRLAPLIDNNRRVNELLNALLLSLPGSPILYYGDEIGMGDNLYLPDRDTVRTPMQWTADRNAGFSQADFAQLYLPPLMDPVYGFQAVNVEASLRNPSSLLHWVQRMLEVRRQHPVFGSGTIEILPTSNPAVFAFLRELDDDRVLCVNNLARSAQPVELDLAQFAGSTPVELMGGTKFPAIGELPYFITLEPHGFFWFSLD